MNAIKGAWTTNRYRPAAAAACTDNTYFNTYGSANSVGSI